MHRKELKIKIKELPVNLSIASLALLLGLAERGIAVLAAILEGPGQGIGSSYNKVVGMRTFWDYYDELKHLKENSLRTLLWRLKKKGLVAKKEKHYKLTLLGLKIIKSFEEQTVKSWDGKWRIVMFDIPEKKREARDWLRFNLLAHGYKAIQKSVFIGKHPLPEALYREIVKRGLNRFLRLMTAHELDFNEDEEEEI